MTACLIGLLNECGIEVVDSVSLECDDGGKCTKYANYVMELPLQHTLIIV